MQKLVHRAFHRDSEIIRLGPTSGVGPAGAETGVFAARPPRFFQLIPHACPRCDYGNITRHIEPHRHGACTSDD